MLSFLMSLSTALLPDRRPGREPTQGSRPDPHHQPTTLKTPGPQNQTRPRAPPRPRPATQQAATQHAASSNAARSKQQHSTQQRSKPCEHKPDAPRYGRQHPWADKRTQQFDPRPHDPQVACNSDDRTFRGTPTNVAIPTTSFQTLGTRLGELHATFPRHHNIRHRKGLQRHYAQPSVRNPQRLEDAYDTRNPGSLTRPRVQPRHEDTNDAG